MSHGSIDMDLKPGWQSGAYGQDVPNTPYNRIHEMALPNPYSVKPCNHYAIKCKTWLFWISDYGRNRDYMENEWENIIDLEKVEFARDSRKHMFIGCISLENEEIEDTVNLLLRFIEGAKHVEPFLLPEDKIYEMISRYDFEPSIIPYRYEGYENRQKYIPI